MIAHAAQLTAGPQQLDLSCVRQKKGISLEQIADSSKISLRYLRAIEKGKFETLPGGIISTSYIRQYARAIDYPETEVLAYFHSQGEKCTEKSAGDQGKLCEAGRPRRGWASRRNLKEFVREVILLLCAWDGRGEHRRGLFLPKPD